MSCYLLHNLRHFTNKPLIKQVMNKPVLAVSVFLTSPHISLTGDVPFQHCCQSHRMYRGFFPLLFQPAGASGPLQIREVSPRLPIILTCLQISTSTPRLLLPQFLLSYVLICFFEVFPHIFSLFFKLSLQRYLPINHPAESSDSYTTGPGRPNSTV